MSVSAPPVCKGCGYPSGTDAHKALCRHIYGEGYSGVTSVTGMLDLGKSMAMAGAAARLTREGENYRQVWNAKRDAGTRTHGYVESWVAREPVDCPPEDMGYLDAVEAFFLEHSPDWLVTERVVLGQIGPYRYGGRFDAIATIGVDNWLLDWKTGRQYPTEHSMQLAAYRFAQGMASYEPDGSLSPELEPLPPIDKAGCVYLRADGTYDMAEYPADRDAFELFALLLRVKALHTELDNRCKGESK